MKQKFALIGILLILPSLSSWASRFNQPYLGYSEKSETTGDLEHENAMEAESGLTVAKQRLDSIVSARSRTVYTYDASGETTLELTSSRDGINDEWVEVDRIEKVNDASGNGLMYTRYYWDAVANQWIGANKFIWSWGENGKVEMYTLSTEWDTVTGQFIPGKKYEYTHDQEGNTTSITKYQWDTDSSTYLRSEKGELAYDADGNRISYIQYLWGHSTGDWILSYKEEFSFDDNGNNTLYIAFDWDKDSSIWVNKFSVEYTFDAEDNNTLAIRYEWDEGTGLWIPVSRKEYTFDVNGFNTLSISYNWDDLLDHMVASKRWQYRLDSLGNTLSSVISDWDIDINDWVEREKTEYSYDYTYMRQDLMTPFNDRYKLIRRIEYLFEPDLLKSVEWEVVNDFTYFYSDLAVSSVTDDISMGELSVYPNPASDYIQVEGDLDTGEARVMMYNVSGKMVMNRVLDPGGRIPVSHLSEGIYVVRLVQGNKVITGKVMIE
jgi:hypothetical protein